MPRPIEELNTNLYLLCRNEETFAKIPNLRDGNLWHATHAELAEAIYQAMLTTPTFHASHLMSKKMLFLQAIQQKISSPYVQNVENRVLFNPREKMQLLTNDVPDCNEDDDYRALNSDFLKLIAGKKCQICDFDAEIHFERCDCSFCLWCFRRMVRNGLLSEEFFPPHCCPGHPWDEGDILRTLRPSLMHLFTQISEEFDVPSHLKLFCADPQCAALIGQTDTTEQKIKCPHCDLRTCTTCQYKDHPGQPCMPVEQLENTWALMDLMGAVNCPGCGDVRSHGGGCNQMHCPRCDSDFCFICGEKNNGVPLCPCPVVGMEHQRVPVERRPGVKPAQFKAIRHKLDHNEQDVDSFPPELTIGCAAIDDPEIMQDMKDLGLYWVPAEYVSQ